MAQIIFERSKNAIAHVNNTDMDWVPIDPEGLKSIYDSFVSENGSDILFNTILVDVVMENENTIGDIVPYEFNFCAPS